MSYAVRTDGQGWRTVDSKDDCSADEVFSETQPLPKEPDINAQRKIEIQAEFTALDMQRIRPLAENNTAKLAELNAQAQLLRDELKSL